MTLPNLHRIAIIGKKGVGKTTELGARLHDRGYKQWSFAHPLKIDAITALECLLREVYGFSYDEVPEITLETMAANKELYVPFLQWLGTDFFRTGLGREDHWVEQLGKRLHNTLADELVVIDDVRFENEAVLLQEYDFTFIRLLRDEDDRQDYLWNRLKQARGIDPDDPQRPTIEEMEEMNQALEDMIAHESETRLDQFETDAIVLPYCFVAFDEMVNEIVDGRLLVPRHESEHPGWKLKPEPLSFTYQAVTSSSSNTRMLRSPYDINLEAIADQELVSRAFGPLCGASAVHFAEDHLSDIAQRLRDSLAGVGS